MRISANVKTDNIDQITRSIQKTSNEFKRYINTGMILSHTIYTDNSLHDLLENRYSDIEDYYYYFDRHLRSYLKKYIMAYDTVEDINVFTSNETILSADTYRKLDEETRQSNWYKKLQTIKNKILVFSYYSMDPLNSERKVSIIRKLDLFPGDTENILKIDLNYKMISQIISDRSIIGDLFLIDDNNDIVYSTDSSFMSEPVTFTSYSKVGQDRGEFILEIGLDDTVSLSGWKIVGKYQESNVTKALNSALGFVVLLSIISITAASLAILVISKSFKSRILTISRHMEKVKNQKYDLIDVRGGADEIGQLMLDFNSMTLKIKKLIQDVYEADIQKKSLELERKQAELNAMQSQINPHFLFNTLESIRIKSLLKNETETAEIVKCLSKIFRRMLVWGNDLITVRMENEYIMDYLRIQKYRFSEKFNYEILVQEEVMEHKICKMTIQPFIENACVHGIEGISGNGLISLSIKKEDDRLMILIEDNGYGISPEQLIELRKSLKENDSFTDSNIGIRNVYNRLKLLYGNDFVLNIESTPYKGTKVCVKVPAII